MIIDLIVVVLIIISAAISFLRGLIREVLTIAGMIGGFFAAYTFGGSLAPVFRGWLDVNPEEPRKLFDVIPMSLVADGLAYAFIFIAVVILISVASHFIGGAVKALGLGPVDRTLGVVFGIARGVVLLALLYLPFHMLMDENTKADYFGESKSFPYIENTSEYLSKFLPSEEDVEETIEAGEGEIKKKLFENQFLPDKSQPNTSDRDDPQNAPDQTGYGDGERNDLEELIDNDENKLETRPVY